MWVTGHNSSWVSPFGHPRINARLPTPQGISQAPTSFIGSRCQGIHHVPLITCPQQTTNTHNNHQTTVHHAHRKVLVVTQILKNTKTITKQHKQKPPTTRCRPPPLTTRSLNNTSCGRMLASTMNKSNNQEAQPAHPDPPPKRDVPAQARLMPQIPNSVSAHPHQPTTKRLSTRQVRNVVFH